MATMNVSLPDPLREWVDERVKTGQYANASDYVRDLIRHDREVRQALLYALIEGERSCISRRGVGEIVEGAKAKRSAGRL